jgi:murein L,D-transpeptidase YcbB/YkuD
MIVNNAVTALQNALAFSDYNLRAKPTAKWQYAGILVGGGKLADNNWGIDGKFGVKTYNAVKAFQKNHGLGQDGIFGNETRQDGYLLFGENSIRSNGYKYQAVGVFKSGSTWYNYGTTRTYAYN